LILYIFAEREKVRTAALIFFIAFMPFSVWIWDIPGSGMFICHHFHDSRLVLPLLGVVSSKDFFILGATGFVVGCVSILARQNKQSVPFEALATGKNSVVKRQTA
jgi:hypothetical protein